MKLTKIFAGMAAAAIATTAMAVTAFAADSTAYNYLFIATDIPCEYNDNDEALVNGQVVTCKDLKVKIGSQEFNVSAAPGKTDSDKLCFQIINKWNSKFTSEITDYTVAGAGEYITIDFTIEGLGDTTGNAGVSFQADGTWDFRNPDDKEKDKVAQPAYFPNKCVGIAVVGDSENTARYAGIRVPRIYVRTMALSGALCGFAGFLAVSAVSHTLSTETAGGRGFTAIIVAWLAKMNPFVMILISALLSFLDKGAVQIASDFGLNEYVSKIISGVILFFILGSEFFINYQVKTGAKHK